MPQPSSEALASPPEKLIENRTSYGGSEAVFSVYDTYKVAERVERHASSPIYCGMIYGKKIIHSGEEKPFDFLPSESLVLPPNETIYIDFPEAQIKQPTKCITVELLLSRIEQIAGRINEQIPKSTESGDWEYDCARSVHFANTEATIMLIGKLYHIFTQEHRQRDHLVDLNISELIVHMLQIESRKLLIKNYRKHVTKNGLAAAVKFIKDNLDEPITIREVADAAYMSKSSFYRYFKNEFGITPVEYINHERIKYACTLLSTDEHNVTEVSYKLGFSSLNYFIKLFKEQRRITPKQYQLKITN